jgi:hypothetical protein
MEEKDFRKAKDAAGASGASAASETAAAPPESGR